MNQWSGSVCRQMSFAGLMSHSSSSFFFKDQIAVWIEMLFILLFSFLSYRFENVWMKEKV